MVERLKAAYKWRLFHLRFYIRKLIWEIKYLTDFSAKDETDGFSIIVTGRNDNDGGDFSGRLQATLDWNLKHIPNHELIYIEWNNINERPSDTEWISKRYPNSRCYIVPSEIHAEICTNSKIPILEYHAKNLGIRRSEKNWILLVNADVFLDYKIFRRMKKLNKETLYGSNYINIKWNNESITDYHLRSKDIIISKMVGDRNLVPVVGNFLLGHKSLFLKGTGYNEKLTDVRKGVDTNGLLNMLYFGGKTMVLGDHYHLDHGESALYGDHPSHGDHKKLEANPNIPYQNKQDWGFINYPLKQLSQNVWQLEKI